VKSVRFCDLCDKMLQNRCVSYRWVRIVPAKQPWLPISSLGKKGKMPATLLGDADVDHEFGHLPLESSSGIRQNPEV